MVKIRLKKPTKRGNDSSSVSASSPASVISSDPLVKPEKKIKFKITRPSSGTSSSASTPKSVTTTIPKVKKPFKVKISKPSGVGLSTKPGKSGVSTVRKIRIKPTRIPGDGYDSEASDIEDDPLVEEALIFRLLPDAELDYVRHCVETGDFKNFHIRWKDKLRAVIYINHSMYAAKLMKLPSIIEAQKTLDKKNLFKAVDISQILLVIKRIESEREIEQIEVDENEVFHSGITAPMANFAKTRFRKKLTKSHIERLEAKIDDMLRLDREAEESIYEYVNPETVLQEEALQSATATPAPESFANGEIEDIDDLADDLEMELEQALEGDMDDEEEPDKGENEEDDEDDDDEDEDDNESDNDIVMSHKVDVDEEEQHNALLKDEINELEATIEQNKGKLAKTTNNLLKSRFVDSIKKLEKELENKIRQLKSSEKKRHRDEKYGDESDNDKNANDTRKVDEDDDDDEDEDDDEEHDEENEDIEDHKGDEDDDDQEEDDDEDGLFGDTGDDQEMGGMDDNDDAIAALGDADDVGDDHLKDLFG